MKKQLSVTEKENLFKILKLRFEKNNHRHTGIKWPQVEDKLTKQADKLWSVHEMEMTGGEPDVIGFGKDKNVFVYCDCAAESPKGRRSLCYDRDALDSRKEHKPKNSAVDMAFEMGIDLLDESQYQNLQSLGNFDTKTSSWLKTPANVRSLGGAIFGDYRFGRVFIYHNGAESYYASRGFRGFIEI